MLKWRLVFDVNEYLDATVLGAGSTNVHYAMLATPSIPVPGQQTLLWISANSQTLAVACIYFTSLPVGQSKTLKNKNTLSGAMPDWRRYNDVFDCYARGLIVRWLQE